MRFKDQQANETILIAIFDPIKSTKRLRYAETAKAGTVGAAVAAAVALSWWRINGDSKQVEEFELTEADALISPWI